MASTKKILVKAPIKTAYLKNYMNEKVTYLEIPQEQCSYSVKEDIKKGGVQFKGIAELTEKKKLSRVISITADTEEMGLMAVAYLAMHFTQRSAEHGELPFYSDYDYEYDNQKWYESKVKIPIISIRDIFAYFMRDDLPFEDGGFMVAQAHARNQHQPYWRSCTREAVCIIIKRECAETECIDLLKMFDTNKNVFVIFLENREAGEGESERMPFGIMPMKKFRALRNNFILSYAADETEVSFGEADKNTYYKNVLKQNILQRGIKVKRGFSYEKIVNLAKSINRTNVCEMLEKIINYALKNFEEDEAVIFENRDFDFVDHFMREDTDKPSGVNGKRLMEEHLVGMDSIKQQVYDIVNVMKYNQLRNKRNISGSHYHNVHVMLGAPGTAKTTVAKYMGKMMFDEKLLPDNRFICINGAELKGMYVGHSAPKTKALFDNYDVIIIDEAYSIVESNGKTDSFGNEAIAQLIIELEKHSTDKLIIFAGYGGKHVDKKDNRMQAFLDANPGIRSRITSTFYFDSYSAEEIAEIFMRIAKLGNYKVEAAARQAVSNFFADRVTARDFGNGREARALLENAVVFAAKRVMSSQKEQYTNEDLTTLALSDIESAIEKLKQGYGVQKNTGRSIGFVS